MELLQTIFSYLTGHFTGFGFRTYWVFLLTALGLAFGLYVRQSGKDWSISGAFQYLFPKSIWLHKSSRVDYAYFAINALVMLIVFTPLIMKVYPATVEVGLSATAALGIPSFNAPFAGAAVFYFLAFILITDFMIFFSHWLMHKVPFLWQFHKVHHAAEVLNPMTLYRQHPVDLVLTGVLVGFGTAIVHVLFTHVFSQPFSLLTFGGLNAITLAFYLGGYNLRHSHIRLSFGHVLDRFLISPEQHQLHHSCVEAHFDKNMGLIFAVWDQLFRTHYLPEKTEEIILGLPDGEAKEFSSVYACYILPFKKAAKSNKLALAALAVCGLGVSSTAFAVGRYTPPSLHLEELTWTEVQKAGVEGYKSIIIPTGGTEQNGAHVVLGKHNHVIRYTAQEIAKRHGNTLVAPVMAYVPEGDISPQTGHMKYTGTLTVREDVFQMVLEDTAHSLFSHGFDTVYILGDSGQSVAAQDKAEAAIQAKLKLGQRIIHLDEYYLANGQFDHLLSEGYRPEAIGYHAGLRDTSELMAVAPNGVRASAQRQTTQTQGATGAYWKANSVIGQKMLELKIEAALKQIANPASEVP